MTTKYPYGPLSLVQLDYWERSFKSPLIITRPDEDAYDYGTRTVAELGVYPTFGHVDCTHRRWYNDLWGARQDVVAIPIG